MCDVAYSKNVATGRLAALFFSLDCKPNCMESREKCTHRDEHHAPLLPGVAGDLARSCDEQLLDAFLAIKRIVDERSGLIERNARVLESEEVDEVVYDEPTDGKDGDAESAARGRVAKDDQAEPPSEAYPSDDDAPAHRRQPRERAIAIRAAISRAMCCRTTIPRNCCT